MGDGMVGADAEALTATGRHFVRSSRELLRHRSQLASMFASAGWVGSDAERSRREWGSVNEPALVRTSAFIETLGTQLLEHAGEQRRASAGSVGRSGTPGIELPDVVGLLDGFRDTVGDFLDDLFDDIFGDGDLPPGSGEPVGSPAIVGLRSSEFERPVDGRDAVLAAMQGLASEDRIARDEIEIRALDNGRYVVVLPGVTDLSQGFDQFVDQVREEGAFGVPGAVRDAVDTWSDNDEPTVRKMRYAYEAALRDDTTPNEYSAVTIEALESAGVPAGAEIMIIGHSFGAYTAVDLAADADFNAADGTAPDGYHVRITHVVAAGAETDWRFDEIPAGTSTLVLNNRFDGVYRAEDLLHGDGHARHDSHVEQNFWGGWEGYGHDEHNYIDWLAGTGNDRVEDWLADAGQRYTGGGTRVSAQVPDPNL